MKLTATVHKGVVVILRILCIFVRKDIRNATRNRINLFSRAKSGKFSSGENKLTYPHPYYMAWAVAYFSPSVYQSLHDKVSFQFTPFLCF